MPTQNPVSTCITLVLRAAEGQTLEPILPYIQPGDHVGIGRGLVTIANASHRDALEEVKVFQELLSALSGDAAVVELQELRKDAERYRWILKQDPSRATRFVGYFAPSDAREAVDAEMSETLADFEMLNTRPITVARDELKPCPFCGGKADSLCTTGDYPDWFVQCEECSASVDARGPNDLHFWNRRQPSAPDERDEGAKFHEYMSEIVRTNVVDGVRYPIMRRCDLSVSQIESQRSGWMARAVLEQKP